MAYRLYVELTDGSKLDQTYKIEEYAMNLYAMALIKKLAKHASVTDIDTGEILLEYKEG